MSSDTATPNAFTYGPLGAVFAKTALPIIFVMGMNGLLAVVDAVFLGIFVGPDALGGVTLMFPLYMLIVALATLVASGMSSLHARHLGARQFDEARPSLPGRTG
jgi:Na+-driven multidrug efflux pump